MYMEEMWGKLECPSGFYLTDMPISVSFADWNPVEKKPIDL